MGLGGGVSGGGERCEMATSGREGIRVDSEGNEGECVPTWGWPKCLLLRFLGGGGGGTGFCATAVLTLRSVSDVVEAGGVRGENELSTGEAACEERRSARLAGAPGRASAREPGIPRP